MADPRWVPAPPAYQPDVPAPPPTEPEEPEETEEPNLDEDTGSADDQPDPEEDQAQPEPEACGSFRVRLPDLSARRTQLVYNAAAAGLGWWVGLVPWAYDCIRYYGRSDPHTGVMTGLVLIGLALPLDLRTRSWRRDEHHFLYLLGLAARIPMASACLALGLYAPGSPL